MGRFTSISLCCFFEYDYASLHQRAVLDPVDLKCSWLESNCCWSNVRTRQQHNWMLAIGAPSEQQLYNNFGDSEGPGPVYLMLSPGTIDHSLSSHMTVFHSCPIKCSVGVVVVKFRYWLLDGMTLDVCLHSITQSHPQEGTYSSCRRLQRHFGHAEIRFNALREKSIAIVSRFGTTNTLGIIDDVRVDYVPCGDSAPPELSATQPPILQRSASLSRIHSEEDQAQHWQQRNQPTSQRSKRPRRPSYSKSEPLDTIIKRPPPVPVVVQSAPDTRSKGRLSTGELSKSLVRERTQVTRVAGNHCLGEGVSLKCTQACIRLVSDLLVVALCRDVETGTSACLCLHKKQDLQVDGRELQNLPADIEKSVLEQEEGRSQGNFPDGGHPIQDFRGRNSPNSAVEFQAIEPQSNSRFNEVRRLPNDRSEPWERSNEPQSNQRNEGRDNFGSSRNAPGSRQPWDSRPNEAGFDDYEPEFISLAEKAAREEERVGLPPVSDAAVAFEPRGQRQSSQFGERRGSNFERSPSRSSNRRDRQSRPFDELGDDIRVSTYEDNGVEDAWTSDEASCLLEDNQDCCWAPLDNSGWKHVRGVPTQRAMENIFRSRSLPKESFLALYGDRDSSPDKIYELNSCSIQCSSGPITVSIRSWRSPRARVQLCYEDLDSRFCAPIPASEGLDNAPHIEVLPEASKFRLVLVASGLQPGDMVIIDELNVHFKECDAECLGRKGEEMCEKSCQSKMGDRFQNSSCSSSDFTVVTTDNCICSFKFSSELRSKPLKSTVGPMEILQVMRDVREQPDLVPTSPCYGDSGLKDCAIACAQRLQESRELEVASCEPDSGNLGMKCVCMVKKPYESSSADNDEENHVDEGESQEDFDLNTRRPKRCDPNICRDKCRNEMGREFESSHCDSSEECICERRPTVHRWTGRSDDGRRDTDESLSEWDSRDYNDFSAEKERPWKAAKSIDLLPMIKEHDVKILGEEEEEYDINAGLLLSKGNEGGSYVDYGAPAQDDALPPPYFSRGDETPVVKRIILPDPPLANSLPKLKPVSRNKTPKSFITRKVARYVRNDRDLCERVECNFEAENMCSFKDLLKNGAFGVNRSLQVLSGEIGDVHTAGIPGPGSSNSKYYLGGWLAPHDRIGFSMDQLNVHTKRVLRLRIYEASKKSRVFVCLDTPDSCPLSTLKVRRDPTSGDANQWITHSIELPVGTKKVIFIAENASEDIGAIAFDDIRLLKPNTKTNIAEDAFWPACTNTISISRS